MSYIVKVKNNTAGPKTWSGDAYAVAAERQLSNLDIEKYRNDSTFLAAVTSSEAVIGDGSQYFNSSDGMNWLMGALPQEVTPTSPKNEYNLKPYGVTHKHIDASTQIFDIILSNKNGVTYNYSCTEALYFDDCLFQDHFETRDGVLAGDVIAGTVTTFSGNLAAGTAKLSKPIDMDYKFTDDSYTTFYVWGVFCSFLGYGEDDLARLQIVDLDGVGVSYGWYTQAEFDAMGGFYIVQEYDECWVAQLDALKKVMTPDGAPANVPLGLYMRVKYYPTDATKTDIKMWVDYIVTVKE